MSDAAARRGPADPEPAGGSDGQEVTRALGRGFLLILTAKLWFLLTGFITQFGLPRLFLRGAQALVAAGQAGGLTAARLAEGMYGDYQVATRTVSWINNTMVQGTIQAVSKYVAEEEDRAEAVRAAALRVQAVLGGSLALAYFAGSGLLASALGDGRLASYFRVTAIIILAYSLYAVFIGYLNGRRRFRAQATFDIGYSTLKTGSILGLALLGLGVPAVLGAFSGSAVAIALIAAGVVGVRTPAGAPRFPWPLLLRGTALVVTYYIFFNSLLNADLWVLKALASRVEAPAGVPIDAYSSALVGVYSGVLNMALLPYQTVLAVAFVIFPLVSRTTFEQDREATRGYVGSTLRYALIFCGLVGVAIAAVPGPLLSLLGKSFAVGAPALRIYVAGVVFFALFSIANTIIIASGRMGSAALLAVGTLALDFAANLVVVPHFLRVEGEGFSPVALVAAASATAPVFALGFVVASVYLRRAFDARLRWLTLVRVGAVALIIDGGASLLPPLGLLPSLGLAVAAAPAYLVGLVLLGELGRPDLERLRAVIGRRRNR